eukprot:jgi/Chlat1/8326/Chrsp8S08094
MPLAAQLWRASSRLHSMGTKPMKLVVEKSLSRALITVPDMDTYEADLGRAFVKHCLRSSTDSGAAEMSLMLAQARVHAARLDPQQERSSWQTAVQLNTQLQTTNNQLVTQLFQLGKEVKELFGRSKDLERERDAFHVQYVKLKGQFSARGLQEHFEYQMRIYLAWRVNSAGDFTRTSFYTYLLSSNNPRALKFQMLAEMYGLLSRQIHAENQPTSEEIIIHEDRLDRVHMSALGCMAQIMGLKYRFEFQKTLPAPS